MPTSDSRVAHGRAGVWPPEAAVVASAPVAAAEPPTVLDEVAVILSDGKYGLLASAGDAGPSVEGSVGSGATLGLLERDAAAQWSLTNLTRLISLGDKYALAASV